MREAEVDRACEGAGESSVGVERWALGGIGRGGGGGVRRGSAGCGLRRGVARGGLGVGGRGRWRRGLGRE